MSTTAFLRAFAKVARSDRYHPLAKPALYGIWLGSALSHLARHHMGLDLLLNPGCSVYPPSQPLRGIPRQTTAEMKVLLLARGLLKDNYAFAARMRQLAESLLESVRAANDPAEAKPVPVHHVDDITPEDFCKRYVSRPHPVILKGFRTKARHWNVAWFAENYGDTSVLLSYASDGAKIVRGPLSTLAHESGDSAPYVHNCEGIFHDYPELLDDLRLDALRPYLGKEIACAQMFLGRRKGSGTAYHCANNTNVFFQIQGQKRWEFVDPHHALLMYPALSEFGSYQGSAIGRALWEGCADDFPLYKYCPRYEAVLEEGDILLNPPWWYHAIENLTEETIGVATRWGRAFDRSKQSLDAMPLFSLIGLLDSSKRVNLWRYFRNPPKPAMTTSKLDSGSTIFETHSHDRLETDMQTGEIRRAWGVRAPSSRAAPA